MSPRSRLRRGAGVSPREMMIMSGRIRLGGPDVFCCAIAMPDPHIPGVRTPGSMMSPRSRLRRGDGVWPRERMRMSGRIRLGGPAVFCCASRCPTLTFLGFAPQGSMMSPRSRLRRGDGVWPRERMRMSGRIRLGGPAVFCCAVAMPDPHIPGVRIPGFMMSPRSRLGRSPRAGPGRLFTAGLAPSRPSGIADVPMTQRESIAGN